MLSLIFIIPNRHDHQSCQATPFFPPKYKWHHINVHTSNLIFPSKALFHKELFFLVTAVLLISCGDDHFNDLVEYDENFIPTISSVAHRGYKIKGAVENTAEAYRRARQAGFQYGETDVQWTEDNIPVCCHLDYFIDERTHDSIFIKAHTLEELRMHSYHGTTISTLEEVMDTCKKYGLGLYLDRFTSYNGERKRRIYELISNFGKEKICYLFGSLQPVGVSQVLEYDSCATIGILYFNTIDMPLVEFANSICTPSNTIILDLEHSVNPIDTLEKYKPLLKENVHFGFFTINNKKTYVKYKPYAASITSDDLTEMMLFRR